MKGAAAVALARLGTVPAAAVTGWLLATVPLLALDQVRPLAVLFLALPAAGALATAAWRLAPGAVAAASWWPVAACVLVAVAFGVVSVVTHAEHVVVRRDPGAYAQTAWWIAEHGGLPVPGRLADLGGPDPALTVDSPGFFGVGDRAVPQFLHGLPLVLAPGRWLLGWTGILTGTAVLGALGILAVAALAARLVGPAWAPLAAAALAVSQPVLHAARTTLSEPVAQLLLLGGLCLLVDAVRHGSGSRARAAALLAGLVVGASLVVRVDALRDLLPLVPFAGWLWARRSPAGPPLAAGLAVGAVYGLVDAVGMSRPYLDSIRDAVVPVAAAAAVLAVGTPLALAAVRVVPRPRSRWPLPRPSPPDLGAALVVAGFLVLLSRPLWQQTRQDPQSEYGRAVAAIQFASGLPVDGGRLYSERSLTWLAWYAGWPGLVLAVAGAALLVHRVLRRGAAPWAPVLSVALFATATTLWRPGITPDHPWADRRFVPVVLPGLVLLATAALAHGGRWVRDRWPRAAVPATAAGGVLLVVPALVASWPLLGVATERGELVALRAACRAFAPGDVAVLVDARARNEWAQPLRAQCGVPTAAMAEVTPEAVERVRARAGARGHRVVLVAVEAPPAVGGAGALSYREVVRLVTREDERVLTERPDETQRLVVRLLARALQPPAPGS